MRSIVICQHLSATAKNIYVAANTQDVNGGIGCVNADVIEQVHTFLAFLLYKLVGTMLVSTTSRIEHRLIAVGRMVCYVKEVVVVAMS